MLIVCLYLLIAQISCNKENPVVEPPSDYQFDSARYRWELNVLPHNYGYYVYPWAPDTDEVLIPNVFSRDITHFKNNQMSIISFGSGTTVGYISGFSKIEGYLFCTRYEDNIWKPLLKRWDGNSFSDIPIKYNSNKDFDGGIVLFKSPSEIWISGKGRVHKFDGVGITDYFIHDTYDTLMTPVKIYYDESNRLKYLTNYFMLGPIDSISIDRIYEFNGSGWSKVYEDIHPAFNRSYWVLGTDVCAFDGYSFYKLIGNSLMLMTTFPKVTGMLLGCIGGSSINDFLITGTSLGGDCFYHWNGKKWSIEVFVGYDKNYIIKPTSNFYCLTVSGSVSLPYLIRGFKKEIK
jgi:hypothetical protein